MHNITTVAVTRIKPIRQTRITEIPEGAPDADVGHGDLEGVCAK